VIGLINSGNIVVREIQLSFLADSLNMRLGKGESEAIALAIELQTDYRTTI
jgi:predicted nucleic acid-binding protein